MSKKFLPRMSDDIYVPETSRISDLKKILLVGAGVGVAIVCLKIAFGSAETIVNMTRLRILFFGFAIAAACGALIGFASIRRFPPVLVEVVWVLFFLTLYLLIFFETPWILGVVA